MADCRLTSLAETDLAEIADYTIDTLGIEQARLYRDGLETCFRNLAANPRLGRSAQDLAPDLRRFEHRSHVVFYLQRDPGVLIVRILHASMDAPAISEPPAAARSRVSRLSADRGSLPDVHPSASSPPSLWDPLRHSEAWLSRIRIRKPAEPPA